MAPAAQPPLQCKKVDPSILAQCLARNGPAALADEGAACNKEAPLIKMAVSNTYLPLAAPFQRSLWGIGIPEDQHPQCCFAVAVLWSHSGRQVSNHGMFCRVWLCEATNTGMYAGE